MSNLKSLIQSAINNDTIYPEEHIMHQEYMYDDKIKEWMKNNEITINVVDSYGGEEQGRDYWTIVKFVKDNEEVYVKAYGWYASHYGSEYEDWCFVQPKQKTVTVFE